MNRNKKISILYFVIAVISIICSVLLFISEAKIKMGLLWLCLGIIWLGNSLIYSRKSKSDDIIMFNRFKLKGNVKTAIRSGEERNKIDKSTADNAFKMQKKCLDEFMTEKGFVKYKTNAYIRCNKINVLEYVDLQKERYGSKTFTVNYSLIPLVIAHDYLSLDLRDRLGVLICSRDVWWDYSTDETAEISFSNIKTAISIYLLPWFEKNADKDTLINLLREEKLKRERYGGRLSDIQQMWLDGLLEATECKEVIEQNIAVFKLPSKIKREIN